MLETPVFMVTLIESNRQVYASQIGISEPWAIQGHAPLEYSYCQCTITSRQPLVVDVSKHSLVSGSPSAIASRWIAYAGIPLITAGGQAVGALCAIDHEARHWTDHEVRLLEDLAAILTSQLNATLRKSPGGRHIRTTK